MSTHVAHHFDDAAQQFEAARLGMWGFLTTEVLFFGGMFTGYAYYRSQYLDGFIAGSKLLDVTLGTLNTAVLLTSSLLMALAIHQVQVNRPRTAARLLGGTAALGCAFLVIKGYEYWTKISEHHVPGPHFQLERLDSGAVDPRHVELFLSLYFGMTGLHAVHMMIGVGVIVAMAVWTRRGRFSSHYYTPVELVGLYWHFVDIVWVFLFPLLYLVR